jgi:transcriptional regulator
MTHKIAKHNIEAAEKHAQELLKSSKEVRELGQSMQTYDPTEQEKGRRIEEFGNEMLEHAQKCENLSQKLIEEESTEVYTQAVEEHIKATQAHVQAIKELQGK